MRGGGDTKTPLNLLCIERGVKNIHVMKKRVSENKTLKPNPQYMLYYMQMKTAFNEIGRLYWKGGVVCVSATNIPIERVFTK